MSLAVFPFSVVPSLVQLPVHNGAPLLVHSHPKRRQHVHAVIQRHIAPPVRRDAVRPAHMHIAVKFREILALENVPLAQQPRPALFLRQIFQHAHIVRVVRHQGMVVVHIGGDKHIVFGMLRLFVPPVDEQPLHPGVPHAAGVAGQIKALWEVVGAAQACRQRGELELRELRGLVHKNNVVLLPLVLQHVALAAAITEYDAAAAGEREGFVRVPVPGDARKVRRHRQDMVFPQLRERAAHDQNAGARVRQRQPGGFFAHRPAFAAAARPAVCDKACARLKKFDLPRVRLPDVPLHQPISSRTSFDITTCTAAPPFPSMGCEALPYTRSSMVFAASIRWGSVAFSSSTVRTSICTAARAAACSSSCALCAQAAPASGAGERRACPPSAASRCGEAGTGACGPSAFWVRRARSGAAFRCARSPCAAVCFAAPASPPRTAVLLLSLFAVFALVCSPPRFQLGFCCAKTGAAGYRPHWGRYFAVPVTAPPRRAPNGKTPALLVFNSVFAAQKPAQPVTGPTFWVCRAKSGAAFRCAKPPCAVVRFAAMASPPRTAVLPSPSRLRRAGSPTAKPRRLLPFGRISLRETALAGHRPHRGRCFAVPVTTPPRRAPNGKTPALAPVRSHFAPRNRAAGHRPRRGRCFGLPHFRFAQAWPRGQNPGA